MILSRIGEGQWTLSIRSSFHEDLRAFVNEAANSFFVLLQIIIRNRFQASADASRLLVLLLTYGTR
jgi:hypothetical protein